MQWKGIVKAKYHPRIQITSQHTVMANTNSVPYFWVGIDIMRIYVMIITSTKELSNTDIVLIMFREIFFSKSTQNIFAMI